jgi:glycerol-3-phosphate O-acyltransferase
MEPSVDLADRRRAFLTELRAILGDLDKVELLAREQFSTREIHGRRLHSG